MAHQTVDIDIRYHQSGASHYSLLRIAKSLENLMVRPRHGKRAYLGVGAEQLD